MDGTTLLLPVAGRSSRYPGMRPKWLLTHPRGTLMLTEAIRGLDPREFVRIVIVALEAHERDFGFSSTMIGEIAREYELRTSSIQVVLLPRETHSQPETISEGILRAQIEGSILVKDSDNYFSLQDRIATNAVGVIDLNKSKPLLVGNKSYVRPGADGRITGIVEKQVVSHLFCCGAYHFRQAAEFVLHFESLRHGGQALYPSSVIQSMLDAGESFRWVEASNFEDWGTLQDWIRFKDGYATIFIELDGVVVLDSHEHFEPRWGSTEALRRNAIAIDRLYDTGKVEVVLLSSRRPEYEAITAEQLRKNSIRYHRLLMGLPSGCRRILVGGFSENNPYEAAQAVNLRANDDRLDELLHRLMP